MELRNLYTFVQVAESKSFTRAAEKLEYSQPTVSFQIKQLEDELGIPLFERIGHTVSLTEEGREVLKYAQNICNLSKEMEQYTIHKDEISGKIRVAMADSLCSPLIVKGFGDFRKQYPHISLEITTGGTETLYDLIDHNEVDFVCTLDKPLYNTRYKISNEESIGVHFICSAENPLAKKEVITKEELMCQPLLLTEKGMSYRFLLEEFLAKENIEIRPVLEMGDTSLLCRLTEDDLGVSFLPDFVSEKSVREGKLRRLSLEGFDPEIRKQILCHRDKWVSAPMRIVMNYIADLPIA